MKQMFQVQVSTESRTDRPRAGRRAAHKPGHAVIRLADC